MANTMCRSASHELSGWMISAVLQVARKCSSSIIGIRMWTIEKYASISGCFFRPDGVRIGLFGELALEGVVLKAGEGARVTLPED